MILEKSSITTSEKRKSAFGRLGNQVNNETKVNNIIIKKEADNTI